MKVSPVSRTNDSTPVTPSRPNWTAPGIWRLQSLEKMGHASGHEIAPPLTPLTWKDCAPVPHAGRDVLIRPPPGAWLNP